MEKMTSGIVEIRQIAKTFGKVRAVDGIDLTVQAGEFLVILGPSGCGKTTLMRLVAGLERPSRGEIHIGGKMVNALPPRKRGIAMVFQSYALYPHMTAFGNIVFPLKAQKKELTKIERQEQVERVADMVSIRHLLDRKPAQLSGGERQRVAIARALVTEPAVLLLDEPLSNLDAKLRATARDELKDFQRQLGITTIFVTHDQIEAMGLGDRIVVMSAGQIQQVGTPKEIYGHPNNIFVATFLGSPSMNLIETEDFHFGFRPENFLPKSEVHVADAFQKFSYHVRRIEYLGADRLIYGFIDGYPSEIPILAKLPSNVMLALEVGETHDFFVPKEELRFFDKASGRKLPTKEL